MPVNGLDHYNIAAPQIVIEQCRAFYIDIIGLTEGYRPPPRKLGYWLYANNKPILHLTVSEIERQTDNNYFNHIALAASDPEAFLASCKANGIHYQTNTIEQLGVTQIFLHDPAGTHLELNCK